MTAFTPTSTGKSGSTQDFTVPSSGTFGITAVGAAGGLVYANYTRAGGRGTSMYGEFVLSAGDTIRFMVGQAGGDNTNQSARGAGGGGATFVYNVTTSTLLLVAGGGGGGDGSYMSTFNALQNAVTTPNGVTIASLYNDGGGGVAPLGGDGGGSGQYDTGGGGGGGFSGDGGRNGLYGSSVTKGLAYTNGGTGGTKAHWSAFDGGYGGGGGGNIGSGGGGGYGGGHGAVTYSFGGGGGSYNGGTNQTNTTGVGTAAGSAEIVALNASPTAPTLVAPADLAGVTSTDALLYDWTPNDPDAGDGQSEFALVRRKVAP